MGYGQKITKGADGGGYCHITNETGEMLMTGYDVFPGIKLTYCHVHMSEYYTDPKIGERPDRILEIVHCREGRMECMNKEDFYYLSAGDIAVRRAMDTEQSTFFPTGHYHGIALRIDLACAPRCLSCFLHDVNVHPAMLMQKFCPESGDMFIARSNPRLEHVFAELYHVPEEVRQGYFKIKVLEILLFLSVFSMDSEEKRVPCSMSQACLAKSACEYLTRHMDKRITIEELAVRFSVSTSRLKKCFADVYGESVYGYVRTLKMQSAARMLKTTDKTVLEIANLHGYENGSKFAAAFYDTMGMRPNEYRWMPPEGR